MLAKWYLRWVENFLFINLNLFCLGRWRRKLLVFDCGGTGWCLQENWIIIIAIIAIITIITIITIISLQWPSSDCCRYWWFLWWQRHLIQACINPKALPIHNNWNDEPQQSLQAKYTQSWLCSSPCIIVALTRQDWQSSIEKDDKVMAIADVSLTWCMFLNIAKFEARKLRIRVQTCADE